MKFFKKWLEDELNLVVASLADIPPENRKGFAVAMYRKRAREVQTALELVAEFQAPPRLASSHVTRVLIGAPDTGHL